MFAIIIKKVVLITTAIARETISTTLVPSGFETHVEPCRKVCTEEFIQRDALAQCLVLTL